MKGNRGTTTRGGSRLSGVWVKIQSWNHSAEMTLHANSEGNDVLSIEINQKSTAPMLIWLNGTAYTMLSDATIKKGNHAPKEKTQRI
jgi:hypothetical protein